MYWDWRYYKSFGIEKQITGSAMFIPKRSMIIKNKRRKKRR
jgi:hypothetical protein